MDSPPPIGDHGGNQAESTGVGAYPLPIARSGLQHHTNPDPVVNATALSICEEKTRQFLKSDYIDDPAIAKNYMTTEFAALWLKAPRGLGEKWSVAPVGM